MNKLKIVKTKNLPIGNSIRHFTAKLSKYHFMKYICRNFKKTENELSIIYGIFLIKKYKL